MHKGVKKICYMKLHKIILLGFLIGVFVYVFTKFLSGNMPISIISGNIPEYIYRRLPWILLKAISYGLVGSICTILFSKIITKK